MNDLSGIKAINTWAKSEDYKKLARATNGADPAGPKRCPSGKCGIKGPKQEKRK